ncbi:EF-hand domain-containing protein [Rhodopirellula sallentina]|uniref:Secreted protein n=1 Tax=Rhodopirellula sallentina SM41 TaxID=1263870 RepID=M5TW06_9BACT|nr:secreted protein [Rhodopirellula sallentina]EMI53209.1 secreted protein [Rhodopirellula sallentina SM41]
MRRCQFLIALCFLSFLVFEPYVQAQPPGRQRGEGNFERGAGGQRRGQGQGWAGGRQRSSGQGPSGQSSTRQGSSQQGSGQRPGQQSPPWVAIFDADSDGILSADEIKNATTALSEMDRNRDGQLTGDELRSTYGARSQARPGSRAGSGSMQPDSGRGPSDGRGPSGRSPDGRGPSGGRGAAGGRGVAGGGERNADPSRADASFAAQLLSLDTDADGLIANAELPEHMHDAFGVADADKNGSLDEDELLVLASQFRRNQLNPDNDQEVKNAPTQGRHAPEMGERGERQRSAGQPGPGQRGSREVSLGQNQRGSGQRGQAQRGQSRGQSAGAGRGGPRDRVRPRDIEFKENFAVGTQMPTNLQVYNVDRELVPTRSVFESKYTVVVSGCLTCPAFRSSYPEIEAVARDFSDRGVNFYFLYQSLAHPENWGFVQPTSIEDRFAQVEHAKELLQTEIPWLTDPMDNQMKTYFKGTPNSQFVFDQSGSVVHRDSWGRGSSLRESLESLVGKPSTLTSVADLNLPRFERHLTPESQMLIERVKVEGVAVPLRVAAAGESNPVNALLSSDFIESNRYVKLRPEADQELLRTGTGKLYLGFRQDPVLGASWNNLATPPEYRILAEGASVTPATGQSPKLDIESDNEPREFLVDVKNWESGEPITIQIQYFACNKEKGWCKSVQQEFTVWLDRDETGGMVNGRSHFPGGGGRRSQGGHERSGSGTRPGGRSDR